MAFKDARSGHLVRPLMPLKFSMRCPLLAAAAKLTGATYDDEFGPRRTLERVLIAREVVLEGAFETIYFALFFNYYSRAG